MKFTRNERRVRVEPETAHDRAILSEVEVPISWRIDAGRVLVVPAKFAAKIAAALQPRSRMTLLDERISRRRGVR